ncbi:MAG: hypothetical protein R2861_02770 [Desulfobacterales bacterium]
MRPTAEQNIGRVAEDDLTDLCRILGDRAEVVAAFNKHRMTDAQMDTEQEILDMLGRRPCTLADIAGGLSLHQNEVIKYVSPWSPVRPLNWQGLTAGILSQIVKGHVDMLASPFQGLGMELK